MSALLSFVRFLFLFALVLATEALAGDLSSDLGVMRGLIIRGQGAAVVGRLEELARQEPDSAVVHCLLGMALHGSAVPAKVGPQEAQRLEQQAADELQVAVSLDPNLVDAWNELSLHFERMGDFKRAADAKLRQARLEPDDSSHRSQYIRLLEEAGHPGAVLEALRAWVAEQPRNAAAYTALGMYLEKTGKDDEAIAAYRLALEWGETDWVPLYLGGLLARHGRWEEAEAAYARGVNGVEYPLAIYGRGVALAKLGKVKLARRMLQLLSQHVDDEVPNPGLIKRLRAVIQDPKIEPVLGSEAYESP